MFTVLPEDEDEATAVCLQSVSTNTSADTGEGGTSTQGDGGPSRSMPKSSAAIDIYGMRVSQHNHTMIRRVISIQYTHLQGGEENRTVRQRDEKYVKLHGIILQTQAIVSTVQYMVVSQARCAIKLTEKESDSRLLTVPQVTQFPSNAIMATTRKAEGERGDPSTTTSGGNTTLSL